MSVLFIHVGPTNAADATGTQPTDETDFELSSKRIRLCEHGMHLCRINHL